jgi:hypothetical protein
MVLSFDCIPAQQQPSLKGKVDVGGSTAMETPPIDDEDGSPLSISAVEAIPAATTFVPSSQPASQFVQVENPSCPSGTVPLLRYTVFDALSKIGSAKHTNQNDGLPQALQRPSVDRDTLRRALGKEILKSPISALYIHRYAHAYQVVRNHGGGARLNVWSPRVKSEDMSLSQIWIVAGDPNTSSLQTVEAGWQVMRLWETPFSSLFVYSTSDNYGATGCYVTKCSVEPERVETFQLWNKKIVIGKPISSQSTTGGNQGIIDLKWVRNPATGSWWLKVDGDWIGFYPVTTFGDGPLSIAGDYIDFGGESTGVVPTSEMGSGQFPAKGRGQAAFQSRLRYVDINGTTVAASVTASVTDPLCYDLQSNGLNPPEDHSGAFFYFGGPGVKFFDPSNTPSLQSVCAGP